MKHSSEDSSHILVQASRDEFADICRKVLPTASHDEYDLGAVTYLTVEAADAPELDLRPTWKDILSLLFGLVSRISFIGLIAYFIYVAARKIF